MPDDSNQLSSKTSQEAPKKIEKPKPQIRQEKVQAALNIITHQSFINMTEEKGRQMLKEKLNPNEIDWVYDKIKNTPPEIMKIVKQRQSNRINNNNIRTVNSNQEHSSLSRFSALSSYLIKGFNIASIAVISSVGVNYLINKSYDKKQNAVYHQRNGEIQEKVNTFNERLRNVESDFAVLPARYVGVEQLGQRLREFKEQTQNQVAKLKNNLTNSQFQRGLDQPPKKRQLQLKFTPFSRASQLMPQQTQSLDNACNNVDSDKQKLQINGIREQASFMSSHSHKLVQSVDNLQSQFKKMGEHLIRIADEFKQSSSHNQSKNEKLESIEKLLEYQKGKIDQLERVVLSKRGLNQQSIANNNFPSNQSEGGQQNQQGGIIQRINQQQSVNQDLIQRSEQQKLEDQNNCHQQNQQFDQSAKFEQAPPLGQFNNERQQQTENIRDRLQNFQSGNKSTQLAELDEKNEEKNDQPEQELNQSNKNEQEKNLTAILTEEQKAQKIQIRKDEQQNQILNLFIGNFENGQSREDALKAL